MWFELSSDLKTASRSFLRTPGTSGLIVFTLAVAIAAATIGFSFVDLALLRGLPVDDTSRVVSAEVTDMQGAMSGQHRVSGAEFLDFQHRATTIQNLAAFSYGRAALIRFGQSQTIGVSYATAEIFTAMGQRPFAGRLFQPGDDRAGAAPVVVLAHHYWQRDLSGRADAIGRTLQIGREHYTVVGVAPPDMEFGNLADVDVWMPLTLGADGRRDARNLRFLARLRDGVSFDEAAAEIATIGDQLSKEFPATNAGWKARLVHVNDLIGGGGFWVVIALFTLSIGLLLAIATANVSNLVMVRTLARARELAVRAALGARKGRLIRQFVTEGMLLSLIAAAVSLPLPWGLLNFIVVTSPQPIFKQLHIDLHEISFVAMLALICPLMFSFGPLRTLSRPDLRHVLSAGGSRGATALGRGRGILVVVQVGLAVILLTVSSLALRSVRELYARPTGMETGKLLVFGLEFNDAQYPSVDEASAAVLATRDGVKALSGVDTVAMLSPLPILGDQSPVPLTIDGAVAGPTDVRPTAVVTAASGDVDRALGLTMLAGEWWHDGDRDAAVISVEAARRYFGGAGGAVGRRISLTQGDHTVQARIVGVCSDIAHTDRAQSAPPRLFVPLDPRTRRVAYLARSAAPGALASSVRGVVAAHAPAVPLDYLETFDESFATAASSDYAVIGVLTGFALLALLLASTGLFGVVSFAAAQRTPEFGTRMALGASAGDVVSLVARDSARLLSLGLSVGLAGGLGLGFAMKSMLFGLSPIDPVTIGTVVALLSAVTLTATALPAWRASRIDPVIALRAD